ncbi:MAG: bifunctional UDP-3-O-[3-hydroxymyristoyl] N-acetylglucosamine deacetylase/3-hydroxyacyl-ACP dehydratase [Bacteroidales bacterium]|nr:bifunctional UDP-3-O-[3-hydroxymyristoyl] N-acetylglucosamine deacetylase/3-hydroxyacyl-ACP dehydratase [Bacteroidales bacterium]
MAEKQKTISKEISLQGKGLHSGKEVLITFKAAEPNSGYQFKRVDLENQPVIRALAENVVSTARGTTIRENGAEVMTIEHVCAALLGSGIDNVIIELNSPEVPIMDGSSRFYMEALSKAGIKKQQEERVYYNLKEKIVYRDEKNDVEIVAYPDNKFSIDVHVDFNSKVLGNQYASLKDISDFKDQIASCKTFVFLHEVEALFKNNLIQGGDLDNALVIVEKHMNKEQLDKLAELFNKPKVEILPEGYLNNTELTYQNEPARHKLLDIIGDLSLIGMPINAKIIARKPGHHANTELAKIIRKAIKKENSKSKAPHYDANIPPVYDINQIKEILPHRPPFLLVDKITYMDKKVICGIKNVTMNEAYFTGHYPKEPIMPGVLQIESMAQVGGILLLSSVPDPINYVLYFLKIENIKFKRKVVPGDSLNIRMVLLNEVKHGIALTHGEVFVGDTLVVEGNFMAQLAKKPQPN